MLVDQHKTSLEARWIVPIRKQDRLVEHPSKDQPMMQLNNYRYAVLQAIYC